MGKPAPSEFVGVTEAAKVLGVGVRQALNLVQTLPSAQQIGRTWMVKRSDLALVPKVRKPGPKPASD
jgi:hypothetical protein